MDSSGNLCIADTGNHRIRQVTPGGVISTVAGIGTPGSGGDGGPAINANLDNPYGVALDSSGNLYIADYWNQRVRQVTPGGIINTVAATIGQLNFPKGLAVDNSGNLLIGDTNNHRVRQVAGGVISTVAGTGSAGYSGDGGVAISAQLNNPAGVAVDSSGHLYIADTSNHRVRQVTGGIINTVAGIGSAGYSGDGGAATSAQLNNPTGVAVDSSGNLYIADSQNQRIRKVTPGGVISTVAGIGSAGYSGDGGVATSAQLNEPYGIAVDSSGNLYIAEGTNCLLRKVTVVPTMNVQSNNTSIVSGDTTPVTTDNTDFGSTLVGTPVSKTFIIVNAGEGILNLLGSPKVSVTGNGFSVTTQPTSPIAAFTGTTNFIIQFAPTAAGVSNGTVSIANNDGLHNPYIFSITGTGIALPAPVPTSQTDLTPYQQTGLGIRVTVDGTGQGRVVSTTSGIDQAIDCSLANPTGCLARFAPAVEVTFIATPAEGSTFAGWGGDVDCVTGHFLVTGGKLCIAFFDLVDETLTVAVTGRGKVSGLNLNCSGQCTATYPYGTTVTLTVQTPRWMWNFSGWRGCDSQGTLKITNDVLCQAVFTPDPNIPNAGDGNGDGQPDAYQDNVVSLPDKVGGNYVTFAVQPDTCVISDVYTDLPDNYGQPEKNKPMPQGLIYFELACPQAQVSLYYHAVKTVKRNFIFRKYGPLVPGEEPTMGWYLLPNVTFEAVMIGGKSAVKASYTLTDGELGDSTGVDGRIVDPGGIVVK